MNRQFVALSTFHSEPLQSTYCKGLRYTVRYEQVDPDEWPYVEPSKLPEYAQEWEKQGLIRFVEEGSVVAGTGQITNTRD